MPAEEHVCNCLERLYKPRAAKLAKVEQLTAKEKFFEVRLDDGSDLGHQPGQFVEVSLFGYGEAPISISSSPTKKGSFDLCVRAAGGLTTAMHKLPQGASIGIRGPFGKGFDTEFLKGKDILFVGGGIGIVPLRSLINYVLDKRKDFGKVTILYGAKNPSELLFINELEKWKNDKTVDFRLTVDRPDESWKGHTGVITTLITDLQVDPAATYAAIVGPPIMYKFVLLSLKAKQFRDDHIIVSLERRMKCGVGKCGHCQINSIYVCQDGPVFNYATLKDLREAF
ncbi:MAG TPA: FAD/NAD(P)-binding protein [Planctomycetota bacterium]|nr:FAD/NAD(P)-binding protein [Planctomycetota bacterium]